MTFVELDRTFDKWTEDRPPADSSLLAGFGGSTHWPQLLELQRVVVLAEAGSGKSGELMNQAAVQQKCGRFGFYATVQDIARDGLQAALRIEDLPKFSEWKASVMPAWFFVDSIDEAKLDGIRLETALRRISEGIQGLTGRANIILSARITDWEFRADLARFNDILPITVAASPSPPEAPREALVRVLNHERRRDSVGGPNRPSVFLMAPLDSPRVRTFAASKGVERVDDFVSEIDRANLSSMAARPVDLIWLVDYWIRNQRFASYAQMLETSVNERLRETNPQHGRRDQLETDRLVAALERIGAALDFGRKSEIAVPDSSFAFRASESPDYDLAAILPDWSQAHREQLLRRPVFDPATYGPVRLHNDNQGVMRSYLAARWLRRRLAGNCPRSAVFELLFAETYGIKFVRPSMHQTVAWLSIWDADVAREVLLRDPLLLLSGGDPSSLSLVTREEVLSRVVDNLVSTGMRIREYPRAGLRRIAQPDMVSVTRRLWEQHKQIEEVRLLLLLIIELGQLKSCLDIAKEGVWGAFTDKYTKLFAGRALLATADAALLDQYADMVKSNASSLRGAVLWDALEKLFPDRVSVDELLEILREISPAQRDEHYGMQINGPRLVEKISRRPNLERLLAGLLDLMGDKPEPHHYEETEAEKAYGPAIELGCIRLLEMVGPQGAPEIAIDAALRLGANHRYRRDKNLNEVLQALRASPQRRRQVLWRAAQKLDGHHMIQNGPVNNLGQVEILAWPVGLLPEDITWLLEDFSTRTTESMGSLAVDAAMCIWRENGKSVADLDRIRAAVGSNLRALRFVEEYVSPPVLSEEIRRMNLENDRLHQEHLQRKAERDKSWIDFIEEMIANPKQLLNLTEPTDENIDGRLFGLWQLVNDEAVKSNRYSITDISFLEPILGVELTATLRSALIAFWRKRKPTLDSERAANQRNVVNSVDCMGLVGVSLLAKSDLEWATRLTPEEAILATQYATIEINGFPDWIESLALAWPRQVGEVLMREVKSELSDPTYGPHHGIFDDIARAPSVIAAVVAPPLLDELRARPEISGRQLSLILETETRGLIDGPSKEAFTSFALTRFESANNAEDQAAYLAAAFSSGASEATNALTAKLDAMDGPTQARLGEFLLPQIFDSYGIRLGKEPPKLPFDVLERLVDVAYKTVRPEEDINRPSGVAHMITGRDSAESARSAAFNQLVSTPGYATYLALKRFAAMPGFPIESSHLRGLAVQRAQLDSERATWPPKEAYDLEQEFDLAPRTPSDLRSLAISRIEEIAHDLHNAEFAQGSTVKSLPNEREVQKWVASELGHRKKRAYSLEREPHVVNENEPDIRLLSTATAARLPIEIKVAESWTRLELEEALSDQLCGKYMRERGDTHGILLLVHQFARPHGWDDGTGKYLNFTELVTHLREKANEIAGAGSGAPQAAVAVIDVSTVITSSRSARREHSSRRRGPGRGAASSPGRARRDKLNLSSPNPAQSPGNIVRRGSSHIQVSRVDETVVADQLVD